MFRFFYAVGFSIFMRAIFLTMKKISTSILYAIVLFPLLFVAMGAIEVMAQLLNLTPDYIQVFMFPYVFITIAVLLFTGIPAFWAINKRIHRFEKLKTVTFYSHIRHVFFYYFLLLWSLFTWFFTGFKGSEDDLYLLVFSGFSVIAICMNLIFLQRHKTNQQ